MVFLLEIPVCQQAKSDMVAGLLRIDFQLACYTIHIMLTYLVTLQTKAAKNEIIELGKNKLKVSVSAPAQNNKANLALISLLATYFNVPKGNLVILRGEKSKIKVVGLLHD